MVLAHARANTTSETASEILPRKLDTNPCLLGLDEV
jgi:hypothetical protein